MSALGNSGQEAPKLARRIGLPVLTLYGLSVTVGAGIYVLIGEVAARSGGLAPLAFLGAGLLVALSAASYAELSVRFPVSAGEAAYAKAGFRLPWLTLVIGLMVCATGMVSSATLLRGGAGYIQDFIDVPVWVIALVAGVGIGGITVWGINQSALTAAVLGVLEVGLLVAIAAAGLWDFEAVGVSLGNLVDFKDSGHLFGLSGAILLAFFAFIGFEDLVNVAEEVREPEVVMPIAIGLTLVLTTLLYFVVVLVSVAHVPVVDLSQSKAPLTTVFETVIGIDGNIVSAIAIGAILNGVLVQIIMASRVLYGLSRMHSLPEFFGVVHPITRTPLNATVLVVAVILALSLTSQTATLAELTSSITLLVFAIVNLALWRIKGQGDGDGRGFRVPRWVPLFGFLVCLLFLAGEWSSRLLGAGS